MSIDPVQVSRADLRLLVLAAGYCVAEFESVPVEPKWRSPRECSVLGELEAAGLLVDEGTEWSIEPLMAALSAARPLVLEDPELEPTAA